VPCKIRRGRPRAEGYDLYGKPASDVENWRHGKER
jgi:hypothetical protein